MQEDRFITLQELTEIVGPRNGRGREAAHIQTIRRWARRGLYGVVLRTHKMMGRVYTRLSWFGEFERAVARKEASRRHDLRESARRARAAIPRQQRARQELEKLGIG